MNKVFGFIFGLLAASAAFAVDLRDASNQQILDELSYRLRNSDHQQGDAQVSFLCNAQFNLVMSIIGPNGHESSREIYLGARSRCEDYRDQLTARRSRISNTVVVAICDAQYSVLRYSLTSQGAINDLSPIAIGSRSGCEDQMNLINNN